MTGRTPQELLDEPAVPRAYAELIETLWHLNSSSGGEGISYREIDSYMRCTGAILHPWECEALVKLATVIQHAMVEQRRGTE
ncbi:phage tail assembly chaperone [Skermanella mucosa]